MIAWRCRWDIVFVVLIFWLLAGCGHMPVTSMVRLARVDFQTTDPEKLRVAVRLPKALRARADRSAGAEPGGGGIAPGRRRDAVA